MEEKHYTIHAKIIERCLNGDSKAYEELYLLYSKAMFNICYRITNDLNDAEDVLQDAFVSAFKNLHSFKGTATFGAWLKRIVVNKAINFVKKNHLDLVPLEGQDHYDKENIDFEDINLQVKHVREALQMLPEGYRMVFSLYLLEGYDHGEIAEIMGITESTSKSQFNRAKNKLREILQKEDAS